MSNLPYFLKSLAHFSQQILTNGIWGQQNSHSGFSSNRASVATLRSNRSWMPGAEAGHVSEPEDMTDEEPEADPEEEYEEYEEDPEEEIEENPEEDQEAEIDKESEEDPEEDPDEDPEEDPEEDQNEESDDEKLEVENSHLSSAVRGVGIGNKGLRNELNDNREEERGKNVIEESKSEIGLANISVKQQEHSETSRRRRKSRWEAPQIDESSKRRKTRWDDNDSQNCLFDPSGFINSLGASMDPKTISLRLKLMEINKKLLSSEVCDKRPGGERSPSPEPIYNNLGIRINTRGARMKMKLMNKRKLILSKLAETNLAVHEPKEKFVKKLFIPEKEHPTYNFIGLILGPKGSTQKKMEKKTGAKILLRGKGSGDLVTEDEKLHVLVEAAEQKALDSAVAMIEKLLIPVDDQKNDHKRAQLMELAKMRGTYKDQNTCELCKEQGHKKYACPLQDSTFKAVCCDLCGSFDHLTSNCNISGLPQFCKEKSNKNVEAANLYVSYLPLSVDDKRLKEMFLPFGGIKSTRVMKDLATGLSKGYGFVNFENPSDAADAVKYMNGYKMDGRLLTVRVAGLKPGFNPLIQTSCNYGPAISMPPQAPNNGSSYFPSFSGYSGYNINAASTKGLNVPLYVVPSTTEPMLTSNVSSSYNFCDRTPSSVPNSVRQFPGDPDYPGSEFKSYFSSPAMNEAQYQVPNSERKSSFWGGSGFP